MNQVLGEGQTFQFSSADATTAAAGVIYDNAGNAVALGANDRLVLFGITGYAAAGAGRVDVFTDRDDSGAVGAGERLLSFEQAGNLYGGPNGVACHLAKIPKVKAAAAGQVTVTGACAIVRQFTAATNV